MEFLRNSQAAVFSIWWVHMVWYLGWSIAMDDDRQSIIQHVSGSYPAILKFQYHLIWKHTQIKFTVSSLARFGDNRNSCVQNFGRLNKLVLSNFCYCQLLTMGVEIICFRVIWQPVTQEHYTDIGKNGFHWISANSGCKCHAVSEEWKWKRLQQDKDPKQI